MNASWLVLCLHMQLDPNTVWLKDNLGGRCYFPTGTDGRFELPWNEVYSLRVEGAPKGELHPSERWVHTCCEYICKGFCVTGVRLVPGCWWLCACHWVCVHVYLHVTDLAFDCFTGQSEGRVRSLAKCWSSICGICQKNFLCVWFAFAWSKKLPY